MTHDSSAARPSDRQRNPPGRSGRLGARIAAGVVLLASAVVLFDAVRIAADSGAGPQQSGFFPMIVGLGLVLCALAFLLRTTIRLDDAMIARADEEHANANWRTLWIVIGGLVLYAFLLDPLGYIIATSLFLGSIVWVVGRRTVIIDIVIAVLFSVATYFAFTELLGVRLPPGLLEPVL